MSWVKEANKIGRYEETRGGYRVYCVRKAFHAESTVIRDGEEWRMVEFTPGHYVAVNKHGHQLETKEGYVHMLGMIDLQRIKDYCQNK